jgi:hypothetical protein
MAGFEGARFFLCYEGVTSYKSKKNAREQSAERKEDGEEAHRVGGVNSP